MTAGYANPVNQALEFFNRTTSIFHEDDADYAPTVDQYTVAQHVAHVAQTIDWFMAGGFGAGFDVDFAAHDAAVRKVSSLAEARDWLEKSVAGATETLTKQSAEQMMEIMADGPIMGSEPRAAVVGGICEHTAHHRGALSVYARLLGRKPPMPYAD